MRENGPRFWPSRWVATLGLIFGLPAFAAGPVDFDPTRDALALNGHLEVLQGDPGDWTVAQVRSRDFTLLPGAGYNAGFSDRVIWYRATVRNPHPADGRAVIEFGVPTMDFFDLYIRDGDVVRHIATGDRRPTAPEQLAWRKFAVPFTAPSGREVEILLRAQQGNVGHVVNVRLWTETGFQAHATAETFLYGTFFGVLAVMALYNLIVGLWTRERSHLLYVFYIGSIAMLALTLGGFARAYGDVFRDGAGAVLSNLMPQVGLVLNIAINLFAWNILEGARRGPLVRVTSRVHLVCCVAGLLASGWLGYASTLRIANAAGLYGAAMTLAVTTWYALKGERTARFFLGAWLILIAGISTAVLSLSFGLSANEHLINSFWQVGVCLETVLLALMLADRLNLERRGRAEAQARANRLKGFLPEQVVTLLDQPGGASLLAPKRREVTVLFTDLRGFTAFARQSEPEEVIGVLREYHSTVAAAAERHDGNVEQFAGDGVMVFFNAPLERPDHERLALAMAFELRALFAARAATWRERGHDLGVGIGLASGYATVGAVGSAERMSYSCIGTVTNLAARLCAQAADGQVLASKVFAGKVAEVAHAEVLGERELKGLPKPVTVCNLMPAAA